MEISKLIVPAKKRMDVSFLGEPGDYITLRGIPKRCQWEITEAQTEGIDGKLYAEMMTNGQFDQKKYLEKAGKNPAVNKMLALTIRNALEANVLRCVYGIDPKEHSFTTNGKPAELGKEFWAGLADCNEEAFNKILTAVIEYQEELQIEKKKTE